ncbi:MAG: hypothetical protein OCD76_02385 [Reichenbachiella sp.]
MKYVILLVTFLSVTWAGSDKLVIFADDKRGENTVYIRDAFPEVQWRYSYKGPYQKASRDIDVAHSYGFLDTAHVDCMGSDSLTSKDGGYCLRADFPDKDSADVDGWRYGGFFLQFGDYIVKPIEQNAQGFPDEIITRDPDLHLADLSDWHTKVLSFEIKTTSKLNVYMESGVFKADKLGASKLEFDLEKDWKFKSDGTWQEIKLFLINDVVNEAFLKQTAVLMSFWVTDMQGPVYIDNIKIE